MLHETIVLRPDFPDATLTSYVCDFAAELKSAPRPAVIVCPGGSYRGLSEREAEPIARKYLAAGYNTYVLRYSVGDNAANCNPLIEVALSVKYVREHAAAHNVAPDRIFVCGFSAGGHLAASSGILWNDPVVREALGIDRGEAPEGINRPNGMILCYPVITAGRGMHLNSFRYLSGTKEPSPEQFARFSLELHVDDTTPPAFLWHTFADTGVSVRNSLVLMDALLEHGVPFESHVFPTGVHGLSLGTEETATHPELLVPHVTPWMDLSVAWIRDMF